MPKFIVSTLLILQMHAVKTETFLAGKKLTEQNTLTGDCGLTLVES